MQERAFILYQEMNSTAHFNSPCGLDCKTFFYKSKLVMDSFCFSCAHHHYVKCALASHAIF